ncbi:PR domain zinc finger protein 13 [Orussus abietinus]|uniref:PR domain zinc finger protein 13 n=1 Tax=Orussus abietinus TaxID=222816 RepID=UPI000626484F|nr:PR domain zinc finger protein 13 [Orussus abietinus]
MHPIIPETALIMSIKALEMATISRGARPLVRAATLLGQDSSTEIIDVNRLSQKSPSIIQYVEVADADGRLYCVDGMVSASCWVKIVTLAKDCQSCNVLLMTTEKGVVLRAIRSITPGEPLLMWFTENTLALMNMPFLTPSNIQGQNRYICHICNDHFEYPNPLKIHLALKCNRLDRNHLWSVLAQEFSVIPREVHAMGLFPPKVSSFKFELSSPTRSPPVVSPPRISPILVETKTDPLLDSGISLTVTSPLSSTQNSPTSSAQVSPSSSTQVSPVRRGLGHGHSAFKPYVNVPKVLPTVLDGHRETLISQNPYHVPQSSARTDVHAAQMETIVSNLGKSKQGHLCIYCGKVYSRKYGLKIHIRTHTGYKPLKCKFCLRPFGDPSNLNKHVRLHADGDTPYRCELCGKVLVRRRDLERHIRSRHQNGVDQVSDTSSDGMDV